MKTVIEMAIEAGFNPDDFDNQDCECEECNFLRPMLERFAALVREETLNRLENKPMYFIPSDPIETAVLDEREECAKLCEQYGESNQGFPLNAKSYASIIRKRGES